jgi:hypothetical protein
VSEQSGSDGLQHPPEHGSSSSGRYWNVPCHHLDPHFTRRAMLMGTNTGYGDHDQIAIVGRRDRLKDAVLHAGLTPAHEAIVAGRGWATELGDIALGRAGAEAPENAIESTRRSFTRGTPRGLLGSNGSVTLHVKTAIRSRLSTSTPGRAR